MFCERGYSISRAARAVPASRRQDERGAKLPAPRNEDKDARNHPLTVALSLLKGAFRLGVLRQAQH